MPENNGISTLAPFHDKAVIAPQVKEAASMHQHICECGITAASAIAEMGRSLKIMRDKKLYIHLGYETFGEYVENNGDYSFKERQAYSYIKLAETYSDSFLQSNAEIGVTKLELLTRLSDSDRAEVIEENDLAGMTVEQVKALIRDKQALCEQLSFFKDELQKAKNENSMSKDVDTWASGKLRNQLDEATRRIEELEQQIELEKALARSEAEKPKPRELTDGELDGIRKKIQAEMQAEQDEKIASIKSDQEKQIEDLKAEYEAKAGKAEQEKNELEKKLKSGTGDEVKVAMKVYFQETQKSITAFIGKVKAIEKEETRQKFISGTVAWLEMILKDLKSL